ncbi:helix-turn-helix DNA binding protein [Mycobacterium phage Raela]|uniref:Helix-turn-helix DNA binding protein n=1 Tax=Mycobacterium phage Raela TaxID=2499054 RepID=A0A3S9U9D6_9CAUD|nr:helix-turn-helix DNA binding protein [Mycobacterium phage Raela]
MGADQYPEFKKITEPVFADVEAIVMMARDRYYLPLKAVERRVAAHLMHRSGMCYQEIAEVMRVRKRSVERYLEHPVPPIYDIDENGQRVSVSIETLTNMSAEVDTIAV